MHEAFWILQQFFPNLHWIVVTNFRFSGLFPGYSNWPCLGWGPGTWLMNQSVYHLFFISRKIWDKLLCNIKLLDKSRMLSYFAVLLEGKQFASCLLFFFCKTSTFYQVPTRVSAHSLVILPLKTLLAIIMIWIANVFSYELPHFWDILLDIAETPTVWRSLC